MLVLLYVKPSFIPMLGIDEDCAMDQASFSGKVACMNAGKLRVPYRPQVLLVVGFHHSGTSLLRHMLGCHKHTVEVVKEMWPSDGYVHFVAHQHGSPDHVLVFKNPVNTRHRYKVLRKILAGQDGEEGVGLPRAYDLRVAAIVRDPRDTAWSLCKRFTKCDLGEQLAVSDSIVSSLARTTQLYKDRMHLIHYEDLVHSPEKTLQDLMRGLNMTWDPEMLNYAAHPVYQTNTGLVVPFSVVPAGDEIHALHRMSQVNSELMDHAEVWREEAKGQDLDILSAYADDTYSAHSRPTAYEAPLYRRHEKPSLQTALNFWEATPRTTRQQTERHQQRRLRVRRQQEQRQQPQQQQQQQQQKPRRQQQQQSPSLF